jgi:hypothetical protein
MGRPASSDSAQAVARLLRRSSHSLREYKTAFDIRLKPSISLRKYVERLMKRLSDLNLPLVLALIWRVCASAWLTPRNVYLMLWSAAVIAHKLLNDEADICLQWYARAGGISVQRAAALERTFLRLCDYRVHVDSPEYTCHSEILRKEISELQLVRQ